MTVCPQHKNCSGSRGAATRVTTAVLVVSLALALALSIAGCGGTTATTSPREETTVTSTGQGTETQIVMQNLAFDPATVTIAVGDTVTWINEDSPPHTVTADNGEFSSDSLGTGQSFSFTFTAAGTYPYHCGIHPQMTGVVIVQ